MRVAFRAVLMAGFEKPAPGSSNDRTAIERQRGPGPMALLRLLVATGLRLGEALALRWSHVDLSKRPFAGPWHLPTVNGHPVISEPKTERSRSDVPLSPATTALLRSVKASQAAERLKAASIRVETGLVFTTESETALDPRNALRAISTAAKARGSSGVGLHTLRHSRHAHARGRRATTYRLGATRPLLGRGHRGRIRPCLRGRALCRPVALSSNGLVRRCAAGAYALAYRSRCYTRCYILAYRKERDRLGFLRNSL